MPIGGTCKDCGGETVDYVCVKCLCDENDKLHAEIDRLKRGEFTREELQNLCHNLTADDACAFKRGCELEQIKLFGRILS